MEYALTKRYAFRLNLFFSINGFIQNDTAVKNANIHHVHPHSLIYSYKYTCDFLCAL